MSTYGDDLEVIADYDDWKVIRTSCKCLDNEHILTVSLDMDNDICCNSFYFEYNVSPKYLGRRFFDRLFQKAKLIFKIIFNMDISFDGDFIFRDKNHIYNFCDYVRDMIGKYSSAPFDVKTNLFNVRLDKGELKYKGYIGEFTYDDEQKVYYGVVKNSNDVIHFRSNDEYYLKQEFKDSIDSYLEFNGEFRGDKNEN